MAKAKRHLRNAAGLLVVAIRSFGGTLLLMSCVGAVLAGCSYYILAQYKPWYGAVGAAVAMLEAIVVGVVWGGKRAMTMMLVHALRQSQIGKATVRLIFERLLLVSEEQAFGERGGMLSKTVERLPLAEAETRLRAAVNAALADAGQAHGLAARAKRWLRVKLIRYVQACTLARFRETGSQQGGVDLLKVQNELEESLDAWLVAKLKASLNLWTLLILVLLPAQVFATIYIVTAFLK